MSSNRVVSFSFAVMFLVTSIAFLVPPVQAVDPSAWSSVSLASLTGAGTFTQLHISQLNDEIGVTYIQSGNIHFLKCASNCLSASSWVQKNADVTGTGTPTGAVK